MNRWTTEQQNAIDARKGTVLVSAAAGSGKTAVLVERVMAYLCDPVSPVDADRLLIVTFTKAAAAEMQERLTTRLSQEVEKNPENRNLRRQQMLLRRANISTIHSFCSRLVQEYFYRLEIAPDYKMMEESELALLRTSALDEVLTQCYEEGDPSFLRLVESFSSDRDDRKLTETILQVYDFVCSHPFPEQWMTHTLSLYDPSIPISETVWGQVMRQEMRAVLSRCKGLTETALQLSSEEEPLQKAYSPALEQDLSLYLELLETEATGSWDDLMCRLTNASFARLGTARGYKDNPLAEQIKGLREQGKELLKKLQERVFSEDDCRGDLSAQRPLMEALFDVTTRFSKAFQEKKGQRHGADFNDLERWALSLLYEKTDDGYEKTELAATIAKRFDEIIVDEYQDTNEAQDMIFRAVSQKEENLFFVGDVKQSIYGFRQAMPQIFLQRRSRSTPFDPLAPTYPACITLDRNFRSRKTVTDTVNTIFRQLMSQECGDVDYDDREALVAGAVYEEQPGTETVLDIIAADSVSDDTMDEDMAVLEARQIAARILEMIGSGFLVSDGQGGRRPLRFQDCTVLLRSANNHMGAYVRELQENGVIAKAGKQPGFFRSAEVAVMVSLLRVISNPLQDIPLASVLMSPIYGFTPDDMADVRVCDRKVPLYLALRKAAEAGMEKAVWFLSELEHYRTLSATLPSDEMINHIYQRTGYCDLVRCKANGERRVANLQQLLDYSKRLEQSVSSGIGGLVRFLDQLQNEKMDLSGGQQPGDNEDAVTVMSVHNSKGLEFPVCILAGCNRRFNRQRDDALLHRTMGLGVKLRDEKLPCRYTTLMREAIAVASDRADMAEELRILYVALTRAKEKLILVTTEKKLQNRLSSLASGLGEAERLDPYVVSGAASVSDWLLTCALRHPDGTCLRELAGVDVPILRSDDYTPWDVCIQLPLLPKEQEVLVTERSAPVDPEQLSRLQKRIDYIYPYDALLSLPSKVTASSLAEEAAKSLTPVRSLGRPSFLTQKGLTPAERGTATHAFMQFCDFSAAKLAPEQELSRLVEGGFLTKEQGAAVDFSKVEQFFRSSIGKRMACAETLWREYRFTTFIPASMVEEDLPEDCQQEPVVLQGAVDCVFVEGEHLVIVDYKTDRERDPAALWARYEKQLQLYCAAMEQCFGKPVLEAVLYSFALGGAVSDGNLIF